jgi:hypothetical protein
MPIPTITGTTFNFSGSYYPPAWSGSHTYNFGAGFPNARQIWADNYFVYAACDNGLNIIEHASELQYSFITYSGGFNSVWANEDRVFLATSNDGIKYLDKTCISGSTYLPFELICLQDYAREPRLRSNEVRYIHGSGNLIVCCTASGVQALGVYEYENEVLNPNTQKCFATSRHIYYTVSGTVWSVNKSYFNSNWDYPNTTYSGDGFSAIPIGARINDIFVTEGTSSAGSSYNTIFIATSSGVCIIDDGTNTGVIYYTE